MSPRAFQTIIVASMGSKDRLELESKVLAAALKQSHARGDTSGVSLAHRQIFMLLRAQQAENGETALLAARAGSDASTTSSDSPAQQRPEIDLSPSQEAESVDGEDVKGKKRKRVMPNIVWTEQEEAPGDNDNVSTDDQETEAEVEVEAEVEPEAQVEPEAKVEVEAEVEVRSEAKVEVEAEVEVEVRSEAEAEAETEEGLGADETNPVVEETESSASEVVGEPTIDAPSREPTSDMLHSRESQEITQFDLSVLTVLSPYTDEGDSEKPTFDAYGILNVDQIASFEEIHRAFLFLARRTLLSLKKAKRKQRRPFLDDLQNLWIAHDILSDPVTRTDFDFRILGLRGAPDVMIHTAPEDKEESSITTRTPLRIGELMQCAELLEQTELEIAADMHKAMPEMLFGAFLVKQGFISDEDLTQVLVGQRLLKNGSITVGHFQLCMKRWREDQTPLEITAVEEGLVSQSEMDRVSMSGLQDNSGAQPRINAEEAAKRNLSVGHAVPVWKDQLDWSEPEVVAQDEEDVDDYERRPIESSLDIEGITDSAPKDGTKKSLRRLMEGIHSQEPAPEDSPKGLKRVLSGTSELPVVVRDSEESDEREKTKRGQSETLPLPTKPAIIRSKGPEPVMFINWPPTSHSLVPLPVVASSVVEAPSQTAATSESTAEAIEEAQPSTVDVSERTSETKFDVSVAKEVVDKPARAEQPSSADFGEVDYDEEDETVSEIDYLDYAGVASEIERIAHEGDQPHKDEQEQLDFSADGTTDSGANQADLLKVLDEAFNGILVKEPKGKAITDENLKPPDGYVTGETTTYDFLGSDVDLQEATSTEVSSADDEESEPAPELGEDDYYAEESEPESSIEEEGNYDDDDVVASSETDPDGTMELPAGKTDELAMEPSEPEAEPEEKTGLRYESRIQEIQSMSEEEATIELEAALAAMQIDNLSDRSLSVAEPEEKEATGTDTATDISSIKGTISMDMPVINMTEGEGPEEQEPTDSDETPSSDGGISDSEPGKRGIEDTTDEIESIKPTELTQLPDQSDPEPGSEDSYQHQRLKSGEWQIVYKLEGSIADMFLTDESDVETTQQMRPRLTEINTIIPSAIRKAANESIKGGGAEEDNEYDEEDDQDDYEMYDDDTISGSTNSGEPPIIKPVSNNFYPNSDSDKKKGDKGTDKR